MKFVFRLLIISLIFLACTKDPSVKPIQLEYSNDRWVSAGFIPDKDSLSTRGGGLHKMYHSGSWIMLKDSWCDDAEGMPGYLVHAPRLFIGTTEGTHWDTLTVPSKGHVKTVFADSTGFFVGTTAGDVLKYLPASKEWVKINVLDSTNGIEYGVYGISKFQNNLIVCLGGFKDTVTREVVTILRLQDGDSWIDLDTPPIYYDTYDEDMVPLQFHKGVEWNGKFYAATMDGVFELAPGSKQWRQLPFPPKVQYTQRYVAHPVEDILVHKNKLVIAERWSMLVYELNNAGDDWVRIDSLYLSYHNKEDTTYNYGININSTHSIHSLVSDGNHLFASGDRSYPKVYMGDYGEPFGNISKGWREIIGEIINGKYILPDSKINDLDVINGYLYAVSYKGLYKIPLKNLDKIIENENDYYIPYVPGKNNSTLGKK